MKLNKKPLTGSGRASTVTINETQDFVGAGGEKNVYVKGGVAYGVYHDPLNAIDADKAEELSVVSCPSVLAPTGLLFKGSKRVGEYGPGVDKPYSLTELYSRTFLEDNAIGLGDIAEIVINMNQTVRYVHSHGIYIVDNNPNNWLVSDDFRHVHAIDCGNWQTKNFAASFIMLSIQDPHNEAGEQADWFAQAILIGNLYIGRHPFAAIHPQYEHLPKKERVIGKQGLIVDTQPRLQAMMENGASFFDKDARLPTQCYPLDSIPGGLRAWLKATYEHESPGAPPEDFAVVAMVQRSFEEIISSRQMDIKRLAKFDGHVTQVVRPGTCQVTITTAGWYDNRDMHPLPDGLKPGDIHVGFTANDEPVLAWLDSQQSVQLLWRGNRTNPVIRATALGSGDGRVFGIRHSRAWGLKFTDNGHNLITSTQSLGSVIDLPNATRVYRGCLIQNMLGSWRVSTFPAAGQAVSTRLAPLEGQRIVTAAYQRGMFMVVGEDNGIFNRYLYMEDKALQLHLIREELDVDDTDLNFTVNEKGGWTHIPEDGVLEATKVGDPADVKFVRFYDDAITTEFRLSAIGTRTAFYRYDKYYQLSVK